MLSFMMAATLHLALVLLLPASGGAAVQDVTGSEYLALSAAQKADRLWSNCLADSSAVPWPSNLATMLGALGESMCPSFTTPGDALPAGRKKVIHSVGVVGRVEWKDAGGHPYTGIFRGAQQGIVRLSLALKPDPSSLATAPGMGLKFLRNGQDSTNLVAMYSVSGQQSWNFFKNDFVNHIPALGLKEMPLAIKFATATRNIRQVGISDWSKAGEDGATEANPVFPYRLRFHPTGDITFPDSYQQPSTADLVTIPAGSTLYQVFAFNAPEELGGREQMIGELVLTSKLVTSQWGDTGLFFRHQDMAEDLRLHPEWNDATPQFAIFKKSPFRTSPCQG